MKLYMSLTCLTGAEDTTKWQGIPQPSRSPVAPTYAGTWSTPTCSILIWSTVYGAPYRGEGALNVYTRQNTRWHVVFIEIQPNAYYKYMSQTAGVTLIFSGVVSFCIL
jgi:hypothetical protein